MDSKSKYLWNFTDIINKHTKLRKPSPKVVKNFLIKNNYGFITICYLFLGQEVKMRIGLILVYLTIAKTLKSLVAMIWIRLMDVKQTVSAIKKLLGG